MAFSKEELLLLQDLVEQKMAETYGRWGGYWLEDRIGQELAALDQPATPEAIPADVLAAYQARKETRNEQE